jgi:hypothetical protein
MSDYARTTLAFPVVKQPVADVVYRLADALNRDGYSLLVHDPEAPPTSRVRFRPIADSPGKFQRPEWLERSEPEPADRPVLARLAQKYRNLAVHTTFDFAGNSYQGSVFVYDVPLPGDRTNSQQSFVRLSFHSALAYALRGTREFGGRVKIDPAIKADLIRTAFELCSNLRGEGFIYGLEMDGPLAFTVQQLEAYLRTPDIQKPPVSPFLVGIRSAIVSRAELIRIWQDEGAVKESTSGFVLLDLLSDSDGWVDDEELDEEPYHEP